MLITVLTNKHFYCKDFPIKSNILQHPESPAQTNLISALATKLPTNGEKQQDKWKTNGPTNNSMQYAAFHWGYQVGTLFHRCFVKLGP